MKYLSKVVVCILCIFNVGIFMQNASADLVFNEKVTLIGTYAKSVISQRGEGEHQGHYKIIVDDTQEVILLPPYYEDSVRPEHEVQAYEGKRVIVTGVISPKTSLSMPTLEKQPQTINIPCFITIENIRLENSE